MSKINHEEYGALKGLDDRWKWIARDKNGKLHIYDKKPKKIAVEWAGGRGSYLSLGNETLQFIQWEDEEAHNIAELVEEYGGEETEVKKQELIKNIKSLARETSQHWPHEEMVELPDVLREIDQLDEPEVLSQEWIDENKHSMDRKLDGTPIYKVREELLQNLLVPKQELPVIPKFVADWIEKHREHESNVWHLMNNVSMQEDYNVELWTWLWSENNADVLARAWLDGFTVEKEPLYRARLKVVADGYIAAYLRTRSPDAEERLRALDIGTKYTHGNYRRLSEFTEEELKKLGIWDSDQWEIEEVEE